TGYVASRPPRAFRTTQPSGVPPRQGRLALLLLSPRDGSLGGDPVKVLDYRGRLVARAGRGRLDCHARRGGRVVALPQPTLSERLDHPQPLTRLQPDRLRPLSLRRVPR